MLGISITKLLRPGSAILTLMSSTTPPTSIQRSIAWSSASARSSASTLATVCCVILASSSSSFRDLCATRCFHHSKTSTLSTTTCNQVDRVHRHVSANVGRMDTGGRGNNSPHVVYEDWIWFFLVTSTQLVVLMFTVSRLKWRLSWHSAITWTCWHRRMMLTSPSSRSVAASWWTINTFSSTSTKNQAIHVVVVWCSSRHTPRSRENSWKRACLSSSTSPRRWPGIRIIPCSIYLSRRTGTTRRSSATACMVSCTFTKKMKVASRDRQTECCALKYSYLKFCSTPSCS